MRLIDRLRPAANHDDAELRYSLVDYINQVAQFSFGGVGYNTLQQTLAGGDRQEIEHTVAAYVTGAYKANGIVFACSALRMSVFAQARLSWQQLRQGRAGDLWSNRDLAVLERPWAGAKTSDLLMRMIQDVEIGGNSYIMRPSAGELVWLNPSWTKIVLERVMFRGAPVGMRRIGYTYQHDGPNSGNDEILLMPDEVAHFVERPDPAAPYRGMSWLTPVIREIEADQAATKHKAAFYEHGATPNMVIRMDPAIDPDKFKRYIDVYRRDHEGPENAYRALFLAGAADAKVVGADFKQLDFKATTGVGETRIAAAAGVHPAVVGLSEGMQGASLNAGNYGQAKRRVADTTLRTLWTNCAGALESVVPPPVSASRLWFDVRDVPFLRDDEKDEATVHQINAATMRSLSDAGWEPHSVRDAVQAGDFSLLVHTGRTSVQLLPMDANDDGADDGIEAETDDEGSTDDE